MAMWLTKHARERMIERGISEAEVYAIFADPYYVSSESNSDCSLYIVTGKAGTRLLTAVFDPDTEDVITVRKANRKERKEYDGK